MKVDVPQGISDRGGTITLRYPRLRRGDDGQSLHRYDEIHDLRVPPGVRRGDTLRVPGMGDAGDGGGPYGDLVCDLTVVPGEVADEPQFHRGHRRRTHHGPPPPPGAPGSTGAPGGRAADAAASGAPGAHTVDISIVEALLGGRVKVHTPAGAVHVTIPPCTSSGARLRLRGRGEGGVDHYVELRIVTPERLDGESRALIERFAELNPVGPRGED